MRADSLNFVTGQSAIDAGRAGGCQSKRPRRIPGPPVVQVLLRSSVARVVRPVDRPTVRGDDLLSNQRTVIGITVPPVARPHAEAKRSNLESYARIGIRIN